MTYKIEVDHKFLSLKKLLHSWSLLLLQNFLKFFFSSLKFTTIELQWTKKVVIWSSECGMKTIKSLSLLIKFIVTRRKFAIFLFKQSIKSKVASLFSARARLQSTTSRHQGADLRDIWELEQWNWERRHRHRRHESEFNKFEIFFAACQLTALAE